MPCLDCHAKCHLLNFDKECAISREDHCPALTGIIRCHYSIPLKSAAIYANLRNRFGDLGQPSHWLPQICDLALEQLVTLLGRQMTCICLFAKVPWTWYPALSRALLNHSENPRRTFFDGFTRISCIHVYTTWYSFKRLLDFLSFTSVFATVVCTISFKQFALISFISATCQDSLASMHYGYAKKYPWLCCHEKNHILAKPV